MKGHWDDARPDCTEECRHEIARVRHHHGEAIAASEADRS